MKTMLFCAKKTLYSPTIFLAINQMSAKKQ